MRKYLSLNILIPREIVFLPGHPSSIARRVTDADSSRASGRHGEEDGEHRRDVECPRVHFRSRYEKP